MKTENELVELLKQSVSPNQTQKEVASRLGISPQYLHDILWRRRSISDDVARALGFEKIISFRRIKKLAQADGAEEGK